MAVVWALGFMGAVGLIGAIGLFSQAWQARRGTVVSGTVVAIEAKRSMRGSGAGTRSITYAPVVEYRDNLATLHRVTASLSGTRRPEVGATVQVSYRPDRPDKAIVMELPGQAVAKWVFLVVGLACAIGAIIVATH